MSLRTHTFRQLGRGFPTFHCTQILGQRPLLPTPTRLFLRTFQTTSRTSDRSFTNLLADADNPPPVQVSSISDKEGIRLVDGLVLSSASIFLEGQVYLWDVPPLKTDEGGKIEKDQWKGWTEGHFELFDIVVPKPGAR
jgi:NADH dehydrogenase [ubiquinone] 1 alpha subcomplex assembly factor 3